MTEQIPVEIIDLQARGQTPRLLQPEYKVRAKAVDTNRDESFLKTTTWETLYSTDDSRNLINRARTLLLQATTCADAAKESLAAGDTLGADQQIMMLQSNLPELFLCRDVSDGMASYVLALQYALKNLNGTPLNLDQTFAAYKGLAYLADNIFVNFAQSLDLIDLLAESGLRVEPPEASALAELLAD